MSAPLHKQGFFEFWGNPDLNIADKFAVVCDLVLHLCFWLIPFAFELWASLEKDRGNYLAQELQMASLWSLIVALIGILIAQIFGLMEQDHGKLYATTYAAIIGGGIGDTPIIVRPNGIPVKAVAVLGGGSLMHLTVDANSGIKSIADLKGKTITALSLQDTTYYALLGMLASAGLSKHDVKAQAAGPVGVWKLFMAGKSQAMASVGDWTALVQSMV